MILQTFLTQFDLGLTNKFSRRIGNLRFNLIGQDQCTFTAKRNLRFDVSFFPLFFSFRNLG